MLSTPIVAGPNKSSLDGHALQNAPTAGEANDTTDKITSAHRRRPTSQKTAQQHDRRPASALDFVARIDTLQYACGGCPPRI